MKRVDTHVHSEFSGDSFINVKNLIEEAKKKGLDGLIITDHGTVQGGLEGYRLSKYMKDFIVIPGVEIATKEGHLLALGVFEEIPSGLSARETIHLIKKQGGLAVPSHPFHPLGGVKELVYELEFDAIEAINANDPVGSFRASGAAKKLNLPGLGASDAHAINELGKAYTRIYVEKLDLKSILEGIKEGKVNVGGFLETGNRDKRGFEPE